MRTTLAGLLALFGAGPALTQEMVGDPAAGEAHFGRHCTACHTVQNEAGERLGGYGASRGANLYGVAGRVPGSVPDAKYTEHLVAYGQTGAVWDEANFVGFILNPSHFLAEALGSGHSSMPTNAIPGEQEAHDVWAYLATFSPAEGDGAEGKANATAPVDGEAASE
jgi:cytochrome c